MPRGGACGPAHPKALRGEVKFAALPKRTRLSCAWRAAPLGGPGGKGMSRGPLIGQATGRKKRTNASGHGGLLKIPTICALLNVALLFGVMVVLYRSMTEAENGQQPSASAMSSRRELPDQSTVLLPSHLGADNPTNAEVRGGGLWLLSYSFSF